MSTRAKKPRRPTAPAAAGARPTRTKSNPAGELAAAARLTEEFHGRPPRKIAEYDEPAEQRQTLADLGRLEELEIETPARTRALLTFRPGVRVTASPDGKQLYFVGGDQTIDLAALDLADQIGRDHAHLGHCRRIAYHTRKGFHAFEPTSYVHRFGEDGGIEPELNYDAINGRLYLAGGSYEVRPEGIVN